MKKNRRKKLLICNNVFVTGGVERVISCLLPHLSEYYDVTLFILIDDVDEELKQTIPENVNFKNWSYQFTRINEYIIQLPFFHTILFKKIFPEHFDILIATKSICRASGLSHIADTNIYWNHTTHDLLYKEKDRLDYKHRINRIRLEHIYKQFDEVWQVNDIIRENYQEIFHLKNTFTIPNPIDVKKILFQSQMVPDDFDFSKHIFTIVMVGRLVKEKGFDRVLHAIGKVESKIAYQIIIIGDGPERNNLQKITSQYHKKNNVFFLGNKLNPFPYMRTADLLFCPSRDESFGLVAMEAMILHTPVIATRTIGTDYVTQNGKYGILIENTEQAIKNILETILQDLAFPNYSLEEAYDWALNFNVDAVSQAILQRLRILTE